MDPTRKLKSSRRTPLVAKALIACVLVLVCAPRFQSQDRGLKLEEMRRHGIKMLRAVKDQIEFSYYDKTFHGMDLDARFKLAEEKIPAATTSAQVLGIIAQAVVDLNDSHTLLVPPLRDTLAVYGWRMQMIGDRCYITAIMPGSDAEFKWLMPGDRIIDLDGYEPTRDNLWKIYYYYYSLRPQTRVSITVESTRGGERTVEVITRSHKRTLVNSGGWIIDKNPIDVTADDGTGPSPQYFNFGDDLIICRLPSFRMDEKAVDEVIKRITGHKTVVLDLRGNPGGRVLALRRFAGYFFDREVKLGDFKMRNDTKEEKIKPHKKNNFAGSLIVLIDSRSASGAELFARLVQLEKRGLVVGDRSSGRVMQSLRYNLNLKTSSGPLLYGLSVTNADIIMSDGKSLERVGVVPDELLLPTADDLRNRRDPILARAASIAGVKLTPEKAGDLFLEGAISSP